MGFQIAKPGLQKEGEREKECERRNKTSREKGNEERKECFLSEIQHFLFSHGWPLGERTEPSHCLNDAETPKVKKQLM